MKLSPKVLYQEVAGESVLLDLTSEQYFGLNSVGTRIWKCLESGMDVESICTQLESEFEVQAPELRADVQKLVRELLDAGLLVPE